MKEFLEKIKAAFRSDPESSGGYEAAAAILVLLVCTVAIISVIQGASQ